MQVWVKLPDYLSGLGWFRHVYEFLDPCNGTCKVGWVIQPVQVTNSWGYLPELYPLNKFMMLNLHIDYMMPLKCTFQYRINLPVLDPDLQMQLFKRVAKCHRLGDSFSNYCN